MPPPYLSTGLAQQVNLNQSTLTDVDILNFALNLEYLEAEFYTYAITGKSISDSGIAITGSGTSGQVSGGAKVTFSDSTLTGLITEIAADERAHVTYLRQAITQLGGTPISRPNINLAALGIGFGNQSDFLAVARALEDIGVTAYAGAAPLIQNKAILGAAARILAVEAFHAGALRLEVARNNVATTLLDGLDRLPPPTGTLYFATNANALAEVRTPGQVLALAFAKGTTAGAFFPNGVNGNVNTASAVATSTSNGAVITLLPNPLTAAAAQNASLVITYAGGYEIRANSPNGILIASGNGPSTIQLGPVTNGQMFFLQDVSNGNRLTPANTLGVVTVSIQG